MREIAPEFDGLRRRYAETLAAGEDAAALLLIDQMLTAGADPVSVLTDVIAVAQRDGGLSWQRGQTTPAAQRAAISIAVSSTQAVLERARQTPITRGPILVACAEREWHALPALMIHVAFRANGWDSTLLGASTSPMRLNQHLQDLGPEAVAVSCSMLGALPATRRFIEASTGAGIPVVVGGAAFGRDDVRAVALGATAWAADAHGAVEVVQVLPVVVSPVPPLPEHLAGEQAALDSAHRELVAVLRERWLPIAGPSVETTPQNAVDADEALDQIFHAVSAALLTGDPRPISETAAWIAALVWDRGVDVTQVRELGRLTQLVLRDYPLARALVEQHFDSGLDVR